MPAALLRPLLALLVAASLTASDGGVTIATPWATAQDISALLSRIASAPAPDPTLLREVQQTLDAHATLAISSDDGCHDVGRRITNALAARGWLNAYRHHAKSAADRALEQATDAAAHRAIIRHYPTTAAAHAAYEHLTRHAWDRGLLDLFIGLSADQRYQNALSTEQVDLVQQLVRPTPRSRGPSALDTLDEIWAIDNLPIVESRDIRRRVNQRRGSNQQGHYQISALNAQRMAVTDGRILLVADIEAGTAAAAPVAVVGEPAGIIQPPLADHHGFVCAGHDSDGRGVLVAVDHAGTLRWRQPLDQQAILAVSSVIAFDDLLVLCVVTNTDQGIDYHLVGHDRHSGTQRWQRLLCKYARGGLRSGASYDPAASPPSCVVYQGHIALCTHNGLLALIDGDGFLHRAWRYPAPAVVGTASGRRARRRAGTLAVSGDHLVAAPADADLLLILDPGSDTPHHYRGPGSSDRLLDANDGLALLAGGRRTLLDLEQRSPRWSSEPASMAQPHWGRIGPNGTLLLSRIGSERHLRLQNLDRSDGHERSSRSLPYQSTVSAGDGLLVACRVAPGSNGHRAMITGYGDQGVIEDLHRRLRDQPTDPRPLRALASLHLARNDQGTALDYLLRAIELDADPRSLQRAGRISRQRLDLDIGGPGFAAADATFTRLLTWQPALAGEQAWWRGRDAELRGDRDHAIAAFTTAAASPAADEHHLHFADGSRANLGALAQLGLVRTGATPAIAASGPGPAPHHLGQPWAMVHRFALPPIITKHGIIGYNGGSLVCRSPSGDEVRWQRQGTSDEAPLIGLRRIADHDDGLEVAIIPGSAGESAGLRGSDRIRALDGSPLSAFEQLVERVRLLGYGATCTLSVDRADGSSSDIALTIGSPLIHPVAGNDHLILASELVAENHTTLRAPTAPAYYEVLASASGQRLWRSAEPISRPHLIDDLLIINDRHGIEAWAQADDHLVSRWRLAGSHIGGPVRQLDHDHLVLPLRQGHGSGPQTLIVQRHDGRVLFSLPAGGRGQALIGNQIIVATIEDGRLGCWAPGLGRRLWLREEAGDEAIAHADDGLFLLDKRRHLSLIDARSGRQRKPYSEWTSVYSHRSTDDHLFIHALSKRGEQTLACLDRHGGSVRWQRRLPDDMEIKRELLPVDDGVAVVLGQRNRANGILFLDGNGTSIAYDHLDPHDQLRVHGPQLAVNGSTGLRSLGRAIPVPPPPVVIKRYEDADPLAIATALLADGTANASHHLARSGDDLMVLLRVAADSWMHEYRLLDSGSERGSSPLHIRLKPGVQPQIEANDCPWRATAVY
ncbi:MAG: outer membrane protein assembly factor BamB family protein, partial [Planctomycetota bacterium]